jgi:hypothetical protein
MLLLLALLTIHVEIVTQPGRKGDCPHGTAYSTEVHACVRPI